MEVGLFFVPNFQAENRILSQETVNVACGRDVNLPEIKTHGGGEVVRVKITLACTECKQRNYNMTRKKEPSGTYGDKKSTVSSARLTHMHKETNNLA